MKIDYYKKFNNGHEGFYKELYLFLKTKNIIHSSFKVLNNKSTGIALELYKIIKANSIDPIKSYRWMELSKEGVEYWLANFAEGVGKIHKTNFKIQDEDKNPIMYATVRLGDFSAVTDATGNCTLSVNEGTYDLSVGKPGFKAYDSQITIEDEYVDTITLSILTTRDFVNTTINTALLDYYNKEETDNAIAKAIESFPTYDTVVVEKLPATGKKNTIYLYKEQSSADFYSMYIYTDNWLRVGSTNIDLKDYYDKEEVNALLSESITEALQNYDTKNEINVKIENALKDYNTATEVDVKIDNNIEEAVKEIKQFNCELTYDLPEKGKKDTIYITPSVGDSNLYDEWICLYNVQGKPYQWVHIASASVDLSKYYTKAECDDRYYAKDEVFNKNEITYAYYPKSEVYNKDETYSQKTIDNKIDKSKYLIVDELPQRGEEKTFYLLKKELDDGKIIYEEYIYIEESPDIPERNWKLVGETADVILDDYYTKDETHDAILKTAVNSRFYSVDKLPDVDDVKPEQIGALFYTGDDDIDGDEPKIWSPIRVIIPPPPGGDPIYAVQWQRISTDLDDYPSTWHVRLMIALAVAAGVGGAVLVGKLDVFSKGLDLAGRGLNAFNNLMEGVGDLGELANALMNNLGNGAINQMIELRGNIGEMARNQAEGLIRDNGLINNRFLDVEHLVEQGQRHLQRDINQLVQNNNIIHGSIDNLMRNNVNLNNVANNLGQNIHNLQGANVGLRNDLVDIVRRFENNVLNQGAQNADVMNDLLRAQQGIRQNIDGLAEVNEYIQNVNNGLGGRINGLLRPMIGGMIGSTVVGGGIGVLGSVMLKGLWTHLAPLSEADLQAGIDDFAKEILLLEE